ncbi:hypothetical protein PIB30_096917, partial [Stylosanthes scabra]|nr:hypothetical protein [Stylosanthes scabra]
EIMKKQRKKKKIENRGSLSQVTESPSSSKATSRSRLAMSDVTHSKVKEAFPSLRQVTFGSSS